MATKRGGRGLPPPAGCRTKLGGLNNPTISCELFNKGGCNWPPCHRAHKCKDCNSKKHGQSACTKGKKRSWQLAGDTEKVTEPIVEKVKAVKVSSLASNGNNAYQFMHAFLCLPAPPRPNTLIKFRFADVSKPPFASSPSPLKPSAWADLLSQYPGGLKVHLSMILCFGAELEYKSPSNVFILSDNLALALKDLTIIEKKL